MNFFANSSAVSAFIDIVRNENNNPTNEPLDETISRLNEFDPKEILCIMSSFIHIDEQLCDMKIKTKINVYWLIFNEEAYAHMYSQLVKYRNENIQITDRNEHNENIYFKWYFFHALLVELVKKSFLESLLSNRMRECISAFNTDENGIHALLYDKINESLALINKIYQYIKRYYEKDAVYVYTIDLLNNNIGESHSQTRIIFH